MKKLSVLALGVVVGLGAVSRVDAGVQYSRGNDRGRGDQVCVYKDIHYQGAEQCYSPGDEINNLGAQSKSISSIRVYGRGTVTVYENTSFRGHSTQFANDVADLGQQMMSGNTAWSDHIDSLRVGGVFRNGTPDGSDRNGSDRRTGDFRRDQPQQPVDGICVYDRPNYGGRSECWNQGQDIADLTRANWSGQIASMRVFGRAVATIYQNPGYRGQRLTVDRDIPDLASMRGTGNSNGRNLGNWYRQIYSMQVRTQRRLR